jgi:hypothetical protein
VKSLNVVNSGDYAEVLPGGSYMAVASTAEKITQEHNIAVIGGDDTILDINL